MRALPILVAAVALAGCAPYKPPGLRVASVALADQSSAGYVLRFRLDARNDNPEPLPLREVRYALRLDGREVFRGVRGAEATLRRFGTQLIDLPAAVPVAEGGTPPAGVVRYELEGTLIYVTPGRLGQVFFDTGVARPTLEFRQRGELDLPAAASAPPGE